MRSAMHLKGPSSTVSALAILLGVWSVCLPGSAAAQETGAPGASPAVLGLDHIPIAVADLEAAGERYRKLGFTLKPGRPHTNGIRNLHAKFPDGTELELITASVANDTLTARYVRFLADGDGPAFLALYKERRSVPAADWPPYVFFGHRNASPTDEPHHFEHANRAHSLTHVWIADEELEANHDLLKQSGGELRQRPVSVPASDTLLVAEFGLGQIVFLPEIERVHPKRPIVGATIGTSDLDAVVERLAENGLRLVDGRPIQAETTAAGRSVFVPPGLTFGLWLEFREVQ